MKNSIDPDSGQGYPNPDRDNRLVYPDDDLKKELEQEIEAAKMCEKTPCFNKVIIKITAHDQTGEANRIKSV